MIEGDVNPGEGTQEKTVPLHEYVGIKEMLRKREVEVSSLNEQIKTLQEQTKGMVSPDDHKKVGDELQQAKTELGTALTELKDIREAELKAIRDGLVSAGVPEETVKDLTKEQLMLLTKGLEAGKKLVQKPDLGTGAAAGKPMTTLEKLAAGFEQMGMR